jgi:hypothetical protein
MRLRAWLFRRKPRAGQLSAVAIGFCWFRWFGLAKHVFGWAPPVRFWLSVGSNLKLGCATPRNLVTHGSGKIGETQMVFCSKCGAQVLTDAKFCGSCGAAVATSTQPASNNPVEATNSLDRKLHVVLTSAASVAVVLLYTTFNFGLIGLATGVTFGICVRLFFSHKKNGFKETSQLDWILLTVGSTIAFILMFTQDYQIQALLLIFVAVRSLIMYLKMSSNSEKPA